MTRSPFGSCWVRRQRRPTGSVVTFLWEMIGFAAQRLMELELGDVTGAAHGERSPDRLVQRDGYRDRDWQTWADTVELRIPKLWRGSYFPAFSISGPGATERGL